MGLAKTIPTGGATPPTKTEGDSLKWKKAQKIEIKSITSEEIKSIKPSLSPERTLLVWNPPKEDSRPTSRSHKLKITIGGINLHKIYDEGYKKEVKIEAKAENPAIAIRIGHGLGNTRCNIILFGKIRRN